MQIKILFFGIVKEITAKNAETISFQENSTINDLKNYMLKTYSSLEKYANFAVAVNETYAQDDTILKENDIVALIPPVSGG